MALDVGDVRIGVALSDPMGIIAQPHSVIAVKSPEADAEAIRKLVAETETRCLVVGNPLNKEGKPGPQSEKVMAFVARLREVLTVEIALQDERFSTVAAQRELIAAGVRRQNRKQVIDMAAAQRILEVFLDRRARELKAQST
ncbi:MAG TPA: Holliday junction resolvase RuvX [Candidatus Hydrogenedentes bacterium]|nr:Holliday junction resolvase RuvX [Candidatus Hydrogenedentota bacterium]HRK36348.1 Holliday junction resolvase RuvX [Candidatus Hydrogenedentota bacterium]